MDKKIVLVATLFLVIFLSTFWLMGTSNDDEAHKEMARDPNYQHDYHSWFRFASQHFVSNPFLWQVMGFIIVGIITSSLIFLITKSYWSFFFYFFGSNYFLVMWGTGLYPQALVAIFGLLLVFYRKRILMQGVVFVIGFGVHGFAPILLSAIWGLLLLQRFTPWAWGKLSLACSPIFGHNTPKELLFGVTQDLDGTRIITFQQVSSFFLKMCPIPFLFGCFKEWWDKKEWWGFALLGLLFVGMFWQINERTLWTFAPFMWLGFMPFFEQSKHKKLWVLLAIGLGVVNFYLFIRLKLGLGC